MPSEYQQWCEEVFGRMPVTAGEIFYAARWFERDRQAIREAREELAGVDTVDGLLSIGG